MRRNLDRHEHALHRFAPPVNRSRIGVGSGFGLRADDPGGWSVCGKSGSGCGDETRADFQLARFFTTDNIEVSDLNSNVGSGSAEKPTAARIAELVTMLNADADADADAADGDVKSIHRKWAGRGCAGDFSGANVGDKYDTSPFTTDTPATGISTGVFIQNMTALVLAAHPGV